MPDITVTAQITNELNISAQIENVSNQAPPAAGTAVNSNATYSLSVPSGGTETIADTPVTTKNTAGTTVLSNTFPSGVAGEQTLANITLTINDQDGVNLFSGAKAAGVNITQAVTVDKSTVLQFPFDISTDTSGLCTITAYNAGTYALADANTGQDGASGTITYSINGGAYAAFPASQVLVAGNTVQAKRTVDTAAGYAQVGGTR